MWEGVIVSPTVTDYFVGGGLCIREFAAANCGGRYVTLGCMEPDIFSDQAA